jgi:hypothetical protein
MDLLQDGPDLVVPVLEEGVQVPPQRPREQQGVLAQSRCVKFLHILYVTIIAQIYCIRQLRYCHWNGIKNSYSSLPQ